ncbi:hypothetical protein Pmar_PMAR008947 [Perkinsus marinus ATCC 50983]|uniref:Uncharacterized protein n=1 Tax=Perkinsus marinus (strain ATCC 50983 / TXsc) TaxID=423536 RepID=C5LM35_PERM5|nr:hypothetical protein Pmar_PMAR008947 [Perkinsus marinus ATCC 50983]EER02166.1 hypothetical protein Pmar_PMAR008947 [Perkinsus marinus ATCC 50983]|eukprot:XP_002769448.1 hypothetical protein Pmar_PMAR008947 [Perkinsus marinus ATCC 50983]
MGGQRDGLKVWFKELQKKQDATALTEEPIFKVLDVKKRLAHIGKAANQLLKIRKPAPTQPPKNDIAESEKIREMIRNITRDNATYDASKLEKMNTNELLTEYIDLLKAEQGDESKEEGKEGEKSGDSEAADESGNAAEEDGPKKDGEEKPHDEL